MSQNKQEKLFSHIKTMSRLLKTEPKNDRAYYLLSKDYFELARSFDDSSSEYLKNALKNINAAKKYNLLNITYPLFKAKICFYLGNYQDMLNSLKLVNEKLSKQMFSKTEAIDLKYEIKEIFSLIEQSTNEIDATILQNLNLVFTQIKKSDIYKNESNLNEEIALSF